MSSGGRRDYDQCANQQRAQRVDANPAEKVAADLRAADGPHLLAQRVRAIIGDRLDILVANAGIAKAASIAETTVEDFDALFAVNVRAPYFLVQQLLPVMCKGSSVILLSSLAAHAAVGNLSAYSAGGRENGSSETEFF